jgi:hypothetical protein
MQCTNAQTPSPNASNLRHETNASSHNARSQLPPTAFLAPIQFPSPSISRPPDLQPPIQFPSSSAS